MRPTRRQPAPGWAWETSRRWGSLSLSDNLLFTQDGGGPGSELPSDAMAGCTKQKSCTQPTDEPTGPAGGDQGCNWVWVPPGSRARHPEACGKLEGRPDGVRIRPEATPRNCLDLALDSWNDACQVSLVSTILSGCFFFSLVFCIPSPGSILMHPSLPLRATGAAWSTVARTGAALTFGMQPTGEGSDGCVCSATFTMA